MNGVETPHKRVRGESCGAVEEVPVQRNQIEPRQQSAGVRDRGWAAGQDTSNHLDAGQFTRNPLIPIVLPQVAPQCLGLRFTLNQLDQR